MHIDKISFPISPDSNSLFTAVSHHQPFSQHNLQNYIAGTEVIGGAGAWLGWQLSRQLNNSAWIGNHKNQIFHIGQTCQLPPGLRSLQTLIIKRRLNQRKPGLCLSTLYWAESRTLRTKQASHFIITANQSGYYANVKCCLKPQNNHPGLNKGLRIIVTKENISFIFFKTKSSIQVLECTVLRFSII